MNIKKITFPVILCCGATMLGSCNRATYKTLDYEGAKAWIKTNYGEGTEEGTIKKPSTVTSEWLIDGKVYAVAAGGIDPSTGYLKDHFTNFLNGYSYISTEKINTTREEVTHDQKKGEFYFKTPEVFTTNETKGYYSLDEKHMNDTINYFFKGANKYGATYKAYSNKTLEISGTFYFSNQISNGYNILEIPYCTIAFNSDGSLKQIKFDYKAEAEGNYLWISTISASYSGATYFKIYKDSKININFNY